MNVIYDGNPLLKNECCLTKTNARKKLWRKKNRAKLTEFVSPPFRLE
jgi:hypothetical protein